MSKDNVFDQLVKDLSSEERVKMLNKLEQKIHVSQDPIEIHVENGAIRSIKDEYDGLSWLDKLVVLVKSFFMQKNKFEITEKVVIDRISRRIHYMNSQYFDLKKDAATGDFCQIVIDLANSVDFLRNPLSKCFGADKTMFYTLMGKLEFPGIHNRLDAELDPRAVSERNPSLDAQEVRRHLMDHLEQVISGITRDDRVRMMEQTRVLYQMFQLSLFPFQQILGTFPVSADGLPLPAPLSGLRKPLSDLADILRSFNRPPSVKLLEAVLFLYYSGMDQEAGFSLEETLERDMEKSEHLVARLREFNRTIYLIDLLKVLNEDPFYVPGDVGGGEDWFHFYRLYWQDRLAVSMKVFIRRKMIEAGKNELLRYWDFTDLLYLVNYNLSHDFGVFAVSMAVLNTFFHEVFQKTLYYPMKIVLVDGNFYKKNNRDEYEKTFQVMMKIGERIRWFENFLEPDGEGGMKIREIIHTGESKAEDVSLRMQQLYSSVNRDAMVIVEDSLNALFTMGKLMNGIVLGNGGTYDTLANLSELGGRGNDELRQSIQDTADDIHKVSHSLQDLLNLEKESLDETGGQNGQG